MADVLLWILHEDDHKVEEDGAGKPRAVRKERETSHILESHSEASSEEGEELDVLSRGVLKVHPRNEGYLRN